MKMLKLSTTTILALSLVHVLLCQANESIHGVQQKSEKPHRLMRGISYKKWCSRGYKGDTKNHVTTLVDMILKMTSTSSGLRNKRQRKLACGDEFSCPFADREDVTGRGYSCYKLIQQYLFRNRARTECLTKDADLVSIQTREENKHLQGCFDDKPDWCFFSSANKIEQDRKWIWEATGQEVTFTNWRTGQVAMETTDSYMCFGPHSGRWYYANDHFPRRAVCEQRHRYE